MRLIILAIALVATTCFAISYVGCSPEKETVEVVEPITPQTVPVDEDAVDGDAVETDIFDTVVDVVEKNSD